MEQGQKKNIYALERSSLRGQTTITGSIVMIFNQKWNEDKNILMIWNGLAY